VLIRLAEATGSTSLLGGLAGGGEDRRRVAAFPCPITTPAAVSRCPPTFTWVKKARHPSAAESDPVLPA